jgi:hypothetical protein
MAPPLSPSLPYTVTISNISLFRLNRIPLDEMSLSAVLIFQYKTNPMRRGNIILISFHSQRNSSQKANHYSLIAKTYIWYHYLWLGRITEGCSTDFWYRAALLWMLSQTFVRTMEKLYIHCHQVHIWIKKTKKSKKSECFLKLQYSILASCLRL